MKRYPITAACMMWFGDRLMLSQRLDTKTFSGYWECVGGKIEPNENLLRGIQREIREETGLFILHHTLEVIDCIVDDPTTDKCFIFQHKNNHLNFNDVVNREKNKRTAWKLWRFNISS